MQDAVAEFTGNFLKIIFLCFWAILINILIIFNSKMNFPRHPWRSSNRRCQRESRGEAGGCWYCGFDVEGWVFIYFFNFCEKMIDFDKEINYFSTISQQIFVLWNLFQSRLPTRRPELRGHAGRVGGDLPEEQVGGGSFWFLVVVWFGILVCVAYKSYKIRRKTVWWWKTLGSSNGWMGICGGSHHA